jgi:hypothetical protein
MKKRNTGVSISVAVGNGNIWSIGYERGCGMSECATKKRTGGFSFDIELCMAMSRSERWSWHLCNRIEIRPDRSSDFCVKLIRIDHHQPRLYCGSRGLCWRCVFSPLPASIHPLQLIYTLRFDDRCHFQVGSLLATPTSHHPPIKPF